ncbi:MAG TPA: radical SAM protein [Acidobacteriota bacterium]|jgi:radical SAM protein with 4Fe4S-binding SPASM domain|nr:radical SAM protein [Acidobacteriota bacterium]HNR37849.1 radical SAM protein [Acidobacteriota bacterium]HNT99583.1 radical SAM protein [Acidobacteriota bacterium]HPB29352.1 radical SAM protein [Acidobacteriota bacterium]HQO26908.1 radical SAM protein [Acidobacteriota bacterium]
MDCPHIPELNYAAFSQRLHESVAGERIPICGSVEVTARCNLRCAHCFINLPANDRRAQAQELAGSEWRAFLDQIVDAGCLWLLLTGGEPFLRPDFLDIYTHAKKNGLLITLFTNGTLITEREADHLAEWRPFAIEITLYGRTQETYERVTGVPGSYARCLRGIELLLDRKLPLKLKTMVLTLNRHELEEMRVFARERGVHFHYDPLLNLGVGGNRAPAQYRLAAKDAVALDLTDEQRLAEWRQFCDKFSGPPPEPDRLYNCGAGIGTFHIDAYGRMSACLMARQPAYDLRRGTFRSGWDDFMPRVRAQKWTRETPCRHCDLYALCGQCPGWALMESGDPEEPVAYLCQIAHLRAAAFGWNGGKACDGVERIVTEKPGDVTAFGLK